MPSGVGGQASKKAVRYSGRGFGVQRAECAQTLS